MISVPEFERVRNMARKNMLSISDVTSGSILTNSLTASIINANFITSSNISTNNITASYLSVLSSSVFYASSSELASYNSSFGGYLSSSIVLKNPSSTDGAYTSIGFSVSTTPKSNIGAKISFVRSGFNGAGDLLFSTKDVQSAGQDLSIPRIMISSSGDTVPLADNTYLLGTSSYRWKNIFCNDFSASNNISSSFISSRYITSSLGLSSSLGYLTILTSSNISSSFYYGNEITSSIGISSSVGLFTRLTSSFASSSIYYANQITSSLGVSSSTGLFTRLTSSFFSSSIVYINQLTSSFASSSFMYVNQLTSSFISSSNISGSNLYISSLTRFSTNINLDTNKGIQFNNGMTAGGTSELFDDYEYGTWTPAQGGSGWSTNLVAMTGRYLKVGKVVNVWIKIVANTNDTLSSSYLSTVTGLPFSVTDVFSAYTTTYTVLPIDGEIYPCRVQGTTFSIDKKSTALYSLYNMFASYLTS